tara:strand:+ start:3585 stop:4139 length:555 start_codon:yes stop_codon:yes gene_type:complete
MISTLLAASFLVAPPVAVDNTVKPIAVEPYQMKWVCEDCSENEQKTLAYLQEKANITDKNALATILGNIRQESNFIADICEGGARVRYDDCHRGGYGLIQWTSVGRYNNLGNFAEKYSCDPSTFDCQLRYMVNEHIFQKYLPEFQGRGKSVSQYMVPAYYWLGWGIKGNREVYANDYINKMSYG